MRVKSSLVASSGPFSFFRSFAKAKPKLFKKAFFTTVCSCDASF